MLEKDCGWCMNVTISPLYTKVNTCIQNNFLVYNLVRLYFLESFVIPNVGLVYSVRLSWVTRGSVNRFLPNRSAVRHLRHLYPQTLLCLLA